MKKITLKKLRLTNFKGIRSLEINFTDDTKIFGANATGKTSIFDAFTWLLFGKDSIGRADFEIKTLTPDGKAIEKIDHEVEGVLQVDGREYTLRRVYSEKWVKQKGAEESAMSGHETSYFWNGVPLKQVDYKKQVEELCNEYVFRLITSPTAFASLSWTERRDMLMRIVGEISNNEIAGTNPAYLALQAELANYKSEDDYKKMLQASIKKAKEEIKIIPARIDEATRAMDEPKYGESEVSEMIAELKAEVEEVDRLIENRRASIEASQRAFTDLENKKFAIKRDINQIEFEAEEQAKKASQKDISVLVNLQAERDIKISKLNRYAGLIHEAESDVTALKVKIKSAKHLVEEKREEWVKVNAEQFEEHKLNCPTCSQMLPESQAAKVLDDFNLKKAARLKSISADGKTHKERLEKMELELITSRKTIEDLKEKHYAAQQDVSAASLAVTNEENRLENIVPESPNDIADRLLFNNIKYMSLIAELTDLHENTQEVVEIDYSDLKQKRSELTERLNAFGLEASKHGQIKLVKQRISELQSQEKDLAKQIAGVEKNIYTVEEFVKAKTSYIEQRVQSLFKYVSFRLFREQLNGGIDPCCDILIAGVPYSDANTASKINAGVDIINTLSRYFGITAPIFVDNRESVTDIINTPAQLTSLVVSPNDKVLAIA